MREMKQLLKQLLHLGTTIIALEMYVTVIAHYSPLLHVINMISMYVQWGRSSAFVLVDCSNSSRKEAIPESVCPGFVWPVAPARGQQVKQVVSVVRRVLDDVTSSAEVARAGHVLQAGQRATSDLLGCADDPLQLSCLLLSTLRTTLWCSTPGCSLWWPCRRSPAASPPGCFSWALSGSGDAAGPSLPPLRS